MDLETAADELYGGAPDAFIERRTALAAAAKTEGDRALAKAIGSLRRPTRSAWLLNLLSRGAEDELAALLQLAEQLREAQRQRSGPDLRRLSTERQRALSSLTRRAVELAAEQDHQASEAVRQEVSQTLQAALADPDVAQSVRRGHVSESATYGGFGGMEGFDSFVADAAPPDPAKTAADAGPSAEPEPDQPDEAEIAERHQREQLARATAEALAQAKADAQDADHDAEEATHHADALADEVEGVREQLRAAEAAEREARAAARTARKRSHDLARRLRDAERAAAEAGVRSA